ncbi:hypothetical protein DIPPA_24253 [Diplonema papillatum]|nr:hypothetical protein DIPPA_24253 [Diplonema papillatum]
MLDDDGVPHNPGSCVCVNGVTDGYKSRCQACGIMYFGAVGTGTGCTTCGSKAVQDIAVSRGTPDWQADVLRQHGIGRRSWAAMREKWVERLPTARALTVIEPSPDLEEDVTDWLEDGGASMERPISPSIPLGYTIQCLRNLPTWVPVGRVNPPAT